MQCGPPFTTTRRAPVISLAVRNPAAVIGTMRSSSPWRTSVGTSTLALLRIPGAHFIASALRDIASEDIEQLEERGDCRADCQLSVVDFDAYCEDPGIILIFADAQRGLHDAGDFFDCLRLQLCSHQTLRCDDAS